MSYPEWLNGSFIIVILTMLGGCGAGILAFMLKSRCRSIKCCCLELERDVIPVSELNNIELGTASSASTSAPASATSSGDRL